jgi:hypothetical protein
MKPKKAVVMPFTRKWKIKGLMEPIFFNKRIQVSSAVKHLGGIIDKTLTWKMQSVKVIGKANKAF